MFDFIRLERSTDTNVQLHGGGEGSIIETKGSYTTAAGRITIDRRISTAIVR